MKVGAFEYMYMIMYMNHNTRFKLTLRTYRNTEVSTLGSFYPRYDCIGIVRAGRKHQAISIR